jgi:uncharacterized membrane protein YiaA
MIKGSLIMEKVWLVVGAISVLMGIYQGYLLGFSKQDSYLFFVIAIVSTGMFAMRRSMRKKEDENNTAL